MEEGRPLGARVSGRSVLFALALIAPAAQAAALAGEWTPAKLANRGGAVTAAPAEPQAGGPAAAAPANCPYHFRSDMPAATFCVYRGVALRGGGELCATDVVVIWSSLATANGPREDAASASDREVYLGFVADPELVVRAIADPRQGDRAEMVGYTLGREDAPLPLAGQMTLRAERRGAADVLRVDLREPLRTQPGSCAFTSYSGAFLGMIGPPSETAGSVDPFVVPRQ